MTEAVREWQRVRVRAGEDCWWFRSAESPGDAPLRIVWLDIDVSREFFVARWLGTHMEVGDPDGAVLIRWHGQTLESAWSSMMRSFGWKEECGGEAPAAPDDINRPEHYTHGPLEVIDIIEGFRLGFRLGNVIKYILRSEHKGAALKDLEKARWYLDREISKRREAGE